MTPDTPSPLRAACYLRVSTDEQASDGLSLAVQEEACRSRAADLGATAIAVYRDDGLSGMSRSRPGLNALLHDLPLLDVVVVWTKDRLARDLRLLLDVVTALSEAGVRLVAIREHVDAATADGILALQVTGAVGEFHARRTSENVRAAQERVIAEGRYIGGTVFGYERDARGDLLPAPAEADVVRELFAGILAGRGLSELARGLNSTGVPTKRPPSPSSVRGASSPDAVALRNGTWTAGRVRELLRSPLHAGLLPWHGQVLPGAHEPLVSRETWERAQAILDMRRASGGRRVSHWAPLVTCGLCGAPGATERSGRGRSAPPPSREPTSREPASRGGDAPRRPPFVSPVPPSRVYLICSAPWLQDPRLPRHRLFTVSQLAAEAAIYRHLELLLDGGMLSRAAELARRELVGEQRGMDEARGRLDELSGRRVRNLGLLHEGLLTEGDFREANRALVEEEEALRATLIPALPEPTLRALEALASEPPAVLLDRLRSLPVETQILTLRSAFSRVEIHPHGLRFYHVADLIPPVTRPLPRYWSPSRGCTDLGW